MKKTNEMKKILILMIILVAITATEATAQSYTIIVNNANQIKSMSPKELALVFLKKKKRWDNGSVIIPIDQKASAEVRKDFSQAVFKKKVAAIRSYWQKAIFSGMDTAPVEEESDRAVIDYVRQNKGAIGYVSSQANLNGVKVITISE